ncbi:MAG: ankyrin repeat domain-containing protein [Deltaproteobacteria bacterium]|nr:ankyrin repeat domain-containing protein [Deltaproteobacteria bacterium]
MSDKIFDKSYGATRVDLEERKRVDVPAAGGGAKVAADDQVDLENAKSAAEQIVAAPTQPEDFTRTNAMGETTLMVAASRGQIEVVNVLLEKMTPQQIAQGANNDVGDNALMMAADKGNIDIVNAFIRKMDPVEINLKNKLGEIALHMAADKGHLEVVEKFINIMNDEVLLEYVNSRFFHNLLEDSIFQEGKANVARVITARLKPEFAQLPEEIQSGLLRAALQKGYSISRKIPEILALQSDANIQSLPDFVQDRYRQSVLYGSSFEAVRQKGNELKRFIDEKLQNITGRARDRIIHLAVDGASREELEGIAAKYNDDNFEQELANIEGEHVRKKVVLPVRLQNEIAGQLAYFSIGGTGSGAAAGGGAASQAPAGLTDPQQLALSRAVAREILEVWEHPEQYQGYGLKLEAGKQYSFPKYDIPEDKKGFTKVSEIRQKVRYTGTKYVELPCDIWISRSADGKSIEVEMQGQQLGQGTFNTVYQAPTLTIDMSQAVHSIQAQRYVTRQSIEVAKAPDMPFTAIPEVIRNDHEFRIAGVGTHTDRRLRTGQVEARDLEGVPEAEWQKRPHAQQIQILQDAANTLNLLHQPGLVHRDIKPGNIIAMPDPSDSTRLRGHIGDWDMLNTTGANKRAKGTTGFKDPLAEKGISTPLTDIYALAKSVLALVQHAPMFQQGVPRQHRQAFGALVFSAQQLVDPDYQNVVKNYVTQPTQDNQPLTDDVISQRAQTWLHGRAESRKYPRFLRALRDYNAAVNPRSS